MDNLSPQTAISELRKALDLTFAEFGEKIGCSAGHVSDLCTGRRTITIPIARKLEELSGKPWHTWIDGSDTSAPSNTEGAAA